MFNNVTLIGYPGSGAKTRSTRNDSTLSVLSLVTETYLEEPVTKGAHLRSAGRMQTEEFVTRDSSRNPRPI